MRKIIVLMLLLVSVNAIAKTKIVNLDTYLKSYYDNKEYKKCYDLTIVIAKGFYSQYNFNKFGIKYNDKVVYTSTESDYYKYHSLKNFDMNSFNYHYMIKNEEVLKYFTKDEVYPVFLKWADSLYNIPNINELGILINNFLAPRPKNCDDIKEIKDDVRLRFKLNEIYKFLSKSDTVAKNKIFYIDNSELKTFINKYKNVDKLNLYTKDFDLMNCSGTISGITTPIQSDADEFFKKVCEDNRFISEEQIYKYLYINTNFSDDEKLFVTYYFFKYLLSYAKKQSTSFTDYSNIEKIILYKNTVCNGYANIMSYFLKKNNIICYHVTLKTYNGLHANNIVIINNKAYYVDLTWDVYYKEINTFKDKAIDNTFKDREYDYRMIKSLDYIISMDGDMNYLKK